MLITNCSPQALALVERHTKSPAHRWASSYPFKDLGVGQSFTVLCASVNHNSLRSLSSTAGNILHRVFRVLHHESFGLYEVVRIE